MEAMKPAKLTDRFIGGHGCPSDRGAALMDFALGRISAMFTIEDLNPEDWVIEGYAEWMVNRSLIDLQESYEDDGQIRDEIMFNLKNTKDGLYVTAKAIYGNNEIRILPICCGDDGEDHDDRNSCSLLFKTETFTEAIFCDAWNPYELDSEVA